MRICRLKADRNIFAAAFARLGVFFHPALSTFLVWGPKQRISVKFSHTVMQAQRSSSTKSQINNSEYGSKNLLHHLFISASCAADIF
jgi:hypothetical protein